MCSIYPLKKNETLLSGQIYDGTDKNTKEEW